MHTYCFVLYCLFLFALRWIFKILFNLFMFMNNEKESLLEELDSTHSIIRFLNPYVVVVGHFASCSITVAKVMAPPKVSAAVSTPGILHPVDYV